MRIIAAILVILMASPVSADEDVEKLRGTCSAFLARERGDPLAGLTVMQREALASYCLGFWHGLLGLSTFFSVTRPETRGICIPPGTSMVSVVEGFERRMEEMPGLAVGGMAAAAFATMMFEYPCKDDPAP